MSNSRSGMSQMNGNSNRRHPALNRNNSNEKSSSNANHNLPHDYVIRYINDSWNAVNQELEKNTGTTKYYKEENHNLKDFRPFNLEAFWGRRAVQYYQQNQTRHS
ncbi:putative uncharacterized protein DDB_G0267716 [Coccinella septempunctata]|uniref:putative uncharacterized protein DDB_G0267716 n=1 Tax=Coccinella septempunctata TaxID=41139 RepID=UPI001D08B577|nr:putative uncharacterized protein DDB_G0267716 [Coccinella septempunctata]